MQTLVSTTQGRTTPYVGVRAYNFNETAIFGGRDADVARVANLVANRSRWRLILLHGQTGCGKSSFLKAGLIPEVRSNSLETEVFDRSDDGSYSVFITSSSDPMTRLAQAAIDLVQARVPEPDRAQWLQSVGIGKPPDSVVLQLSTSASLLARCFEELAPVLRRPLLLIVDQAEELFTLRADEEADRTRALYFDFLAAYCERTSWIQILISMRTEFFGRFDDELRRRLGDSMPVAPYYLQPLTVELLENVVKQPEDRTFQSSRGVDYTLRLEAELPRHIAVSVAELFPGPGALTCLQIVCRRLTEHALARLPPYAYWGGPQILFITHQMLTDIGPIKFAIEDVIDQAVATFCDQRGLLLIEGFRLWDACKRALSSLVNQQTGGAPTTHFMQRAAFIEKIVKELSDRAPSLRIARLAAGRRDARPAQISGSLDDLPTILALLDHLKSPEVRVLREFDFTEAGYKESRRYVALGHDTLSVALAELPARDNAIQRMEAVLARRESRRLVAWAVIFGLGTAWIAAILAGEVSKRPLAPAVSVAWGGFVGAAAGLYIGLLDNMVRQRKYSRELKIAIERFAKEYPPLDERHPSRFLAFLGSKYLLSRFATVGVLYRDLTAEARRRAASEGSAVFPGGARY